MELNIEAQMARIKAARDKAERKLKEEWMAKGNPPLSGKLKVIRLFSQIVEKLEA